MLAGKAVYGVVFGFTGFIGFFALFEGWVLHLHLYQLLQDFKASSRDAATPTVSLPGCLSLRKCTTTASEVTQFCQHFLGKTS